MSKPIVAIIGKPNVGKSTFFNYLVGSRISIVEDTPGVTRDRIYADTNWRGRYIKKISFLSTISIVFMEENLKYDKRIWRDDGVSAGGIGLP